MSRTMLVLLAAVAVLVLAGCSKQPPEVAVNDQVPAAERTEAATEGGSEGGGGGETLTFEAEDIKFTAAPRNASAGTATIELVNNGAAQHNVTIDEAGGTVVEATGGETATGDVELEPGSYDYYCSVPGHKDLMNGTLTVK